MVSCNAAGSSRRQTPSGQVGGCTAGFRGALSRRPAGFSVENGSTNTSKSAPFPPLAYFAYTGTFMKLQSHTITQGRDRAPARAMLKAIGFTDEDLAKPIIGVANTWIETMPCNYNLRELAVKVKEGIRAAGGTPMEFNTIAISDGVTMGTEGMKASLVSREVIADSIELLVRGHMFDGIVALVACDKTIPGAAMALLRLNIPGVIMYGGTILPGRYKDRDISIMDVFEAVGA